MVNFEKFYEHPFWKTSVRVYFYISFFDDLDEIAAHPDKEDYLKKVTTSLDTETMAVKSNVIN